MNTGSLCWRKASWVPDGAIVGEERDGFRPRRQLRRLEVRIGDEVDEARSTVGFVKGINTEGVARAFQIAVFVPPGNRLIEHPAESCRGEGDVNEVDP